MKRILSLTGCSRTCETTGGVDYLYSDHGPKAEVFDFNRIKPSSSFFVKLVDFVSFHRSESIFGDFFQSTL